MMGSPSFLASALPGGDGRISGPLGPLGAGAAQAGPTPPLAQSRCQQRVRPAAGALSVAFGQHDCNDA
jgi:hypothetical protein